MLLGFAACGRVGYSRDSGPTAVHASRFGASQGDQAVAVAVGPSGDVAVAGFFSGEVDFGERSAVGVEGEELYLLGLDAVGAPRWLVTAGGPGMDRATAVAVGPDGRTCLAGMFTQSIAIGETELDSRGDSDVLVLCTDPAGDLLWVRQIGGAGQDEATALRIAPDLSVVVVGSFEETLRVEAMQIRSVGDDDAFLLRLDAEGNPRWLRSHGGVASDRATGVALAPDSGVYVVRDELKLPDGISEVSFGTLLTPKVVLARHDDTGRVVWERTYASDGQVHSGNIASAPAGVFLAAAYSGTLTHDAVVLSNDTVFDGLALLQVNAEGTLVLGESITGSHSVLPRAVDATDTGVFVTGAFWGTVQFGDAVVDSVGGGDAFLARFSEDAIPEWFQRVGGPFGDLGQSVATGARDVWIAGFAQGEVDVLPTPPDSGAEDAMLLRYPQ